MVPFKKLTKADLRLLSSFASVEGSDAALSEVCNQMSGEGDVLLTVTDGMLCLRQYVGGVYYYSWPVGSGNLRLVLVQIMEDAERFGTSWCIVGVPTAEKDAMERALPSHFLYENSESFSHLSVVRLHKTLHGVVPSLVARPKHGYTDSLFYNNERMVPTVGEDGWDSK